MTVNIQDQQMTTIKVSRTVRDALREQAGGATFNDFLAALLAQEEKRRFFAALKEQISVTPPELMESYREETAAWETTELADQQW